MKPGVYYDLPFEDYKNSPAISNSDCSNYQISPAHFKYFKGRSESESDRKDWKDFGTLVHCALLEPERFAKEFIIKPKFDKRKKGMKKAEEEWLAAHAGRVLGTEEQLERYREIEKRIDDHALIRGLLHNSKNEVSIFWQDEETGLLLKARSDAVNETLATVIDVKTTRSSHQERFLGEIQRRKYYRQGAMYRWAWQTLGFDFPNYSIIALEKDAPYNPNIFRITKFWLDSGLKEQKKILHQIAKSFEEDSFPGYPEIVHDADPPLWAINELMENEDGE